MLAVFPLLPARWRLAARRTWSRRLLSALGLQLEIEGELPPHGSLLVANHVSWVDIFAVNALAPAAFISKAEVRRWPLIGWLAAHNETVFLRRGSRGHARIVNRQIIDLLQRGRIVALFPEGTTSDGSGVLHFHGALLQPAIEAGAPIAPLAIRYCDADGRPSAVPAYVGDMSLLQCIANIVRSRGLHACLSCLPAEDSRERQRKLLTRQLHARIAARLESSAAPADEESMPSLAA